ncbi:hypothetical protein GQ53DRAFT_543282 [Thozetella sp. PMI_491]|nr:hypothetical protein GQ53DRAFT_543282 [Thozetella sp. PMI_491]
MYTALLRYSTGLSTQCNSGDISSWTRLRPAAIIGLPAQLPIILSNTTIFPSGVWDQPPVGNMEYACGDASAIKPPPCPRTTLCKGDGDATSIIIWINAYIHATASSVSITRKSRPPVAAGPRSQRKGVRQTPPKRPGQMLTLLPYTRTDS